MMASSRALWALLVVGLILNGLGVLLVVLYFSPPEPPAPGFERPPAVSRPKPEVPGPALRIVAHYPGANAQVVEESVTVPIEDQLHGMDNLVTFESISTNDGTATITLYLRPGTDPAIGQVLAQNRVSLALPVLPQSVQLQGITVLPVDGALPAMWVLLSSPDNRFDTRYLNDYGEVQLDPLLKAVPGVRSVSVGSEQKHGMRICVDPQKLAVRGLTLDDVVKRLRAVGGKIEDADGLQDIIVKVDEGAARRIHLKDVASVEVGATGREIASFQGGRPVVPVAITFQRGEAPEEVGDGVRQCLDLLRKRMPDGIDGSLLAGPALPGFEGLVLDGRLATANQERVREIAARAAKAVEKIVDPKKGKILVTDVIGLPVDDPASFRFYLALLPSDDRNFSLDEARAAVRRAVAPIDALFRVVPAETTPLPPARRTPVAVALYGADDAASPLADMILDRMAKHPALTETWREDGASTPQTYFDIDRNRARILGVSMNEVTSNLQIAAGVVDIGNFNRFGRTWSISVQLPPEIRDRTEVIKQTMVRNDKGEMVPLGSILTIREGSGPSVLHRLDDVRSVLLTAWPAKDVSVDEARQRCRELIEQMRKERKLPDGCLVEVLSPRSRR
jgi:multidrug efflux pump subunit AcrB